MKNIFNILRIDHNMSSVLDERALYIVGKNEKNKAIAVVWDDENDRPGALTMEIHKNILDEAKMLGLEKPVFIYGSVNAGPNGSPSYVFVQV